MSCHWFPPLALVTATLGLSVTSLVVVTYSPVYMPTLVLGLHTRIPTRAPFEMAVSNIGVSAHQHWV